MPHLNCSLTAIEVGENRFTMRDQNPYFYFLLFGFFIVLTCMFIHVCTCRCI